MFSKGVPQNWSNCSDSLISKYFFVSGMIKAVTPSCAVVMNIRPVCKQTVKDFW